MSTQLEAAEQGECFTCRVVGSGALAAVGIYALSASRSSAPGTVAGKRIVGAIGIASLIGSVVRWKQTAGNSANASVSKETSN